MQQSSTARIRSAQEVNPTEQTNVAVLVSKGDGAQVSKASPFDMALISLPENGPVAAQAFAKFLTQMLPGVSLDIQSGHTGTGTGERPVMVLARDPVLSLAWRIHEGASPDLAFAEWKDSAKALLALQRRDRRRIVLVDPAILEPRMLLARNVLVRRLEKILPHSAVVAPAVPRLQEAGESSHTDILDPEAFVLAISLLADQSAADLVQELRAVTIGTIEARGTQELALAAWKKANQARTRTSLLCDQLELQTARAELDIQRLQDKAELLGENLKAQLKSSEDSAQVWEAERQDFARQLAERDRQIAAARKEGADARTELKRLQDKAELLGENLKAQLKSSEDSAQVWEAERQDFARQLAERDRQIAAARKEGADARTELKRLQDKAELLGENLKAQLKSSEDSAQVWEAERQDFARQLAERDRQIAAARKEGADARTELKRLQDKAELLGENLVLQDKLRQELSDKFTALEKRFVQGQEALAVEKARAKREREQLIAQKAAVEARRAHAQGRIEALLSSRSWRVTRPLRAVTGLALSRS
ncbi:hypothetical protein [Paracoccus sanguinis]|uniref:hypothetical protein n=1 Tax=Paracoccus sanguinis TaxID=1545044 RepID=UPI0012E007B8|nr:hypothetical protein [Paracoccus sanguinis]